MNPVVKRGWDESSLEGMVLLGAGGSSWDKRQLSSEEQPGLLPASPPCALCQLAQLMPWCSGVSLSPHERLSLSPPGLGRRDAQLILLCKSITREAGKGEQLIPACHPMEALPSITES